MTTTNRPRDRSKASEHAIFLWREVHVPLAAFSAALPEAVKSLKGKLALLVPAPAGPRNWPVTLLVAPTGDSDDWSVELRLSSRHDNVHFFEGDMRLDHLPHATRVLLVGRFTFPAQELRLTDERALHDLAEDNLVRIFESLLLEVESSVAPVRN